MSQRRMVVLCMSVALIIQLSAAESRSAESKVKQITCTGKVIDERDRPIAGVNVSLH